MPVPAAPPTLALLAGMAFGWHRPDLAGWPLALCVVVAAGEAIRRGATEPATRGFVAAVLVGFGAVGWLLVAVAVQSAQTTTLWRWYERHNPSDVVVVEGRLSRDATPTPYGASLPLDVERVWHAGQTVPVQGGVRVAVGGNEVVRLLHAWTAGRQVRAPMTLRPAAPFLNPGVPDQRLTLMWRGVALLGSVKSGLLVEVQDPGSVWEELTARVRRIVRRSVTESVGRYGADAAGVVTAVLIGDRAGLDPETTRRLQEGGTYHVIAISGGNIAILSGVLLLGLRLLRFSARLSAVVTIAVLLGYAQLVGSEASVTRATFAATVFLAARAFDYRSGPINTLALSAGWLLVATPLSIADPGFLLTFGATLGILVGVPRVVEPTRAVVVTRVRPRVGVDRGVTWLVVALVGLFAATVCAELALLPVAASAFSRVSAAGLVLNFVAVPLMTVAQTAGMLTVVLGFVSDTGARGCGYVAYLAASGIVESARLVDLWPWLAHRIPAPGAGVVAAYYGGWVLMLGGWGRPARRVGGVVVMLAGLLILGAPLGLTSTRLTCSDRPATVRARFLDVDQADATLIQVSSGHSLLVDAGGQVRGAFPVGLRVVSPALWHAGVTRLDFLAISHGDPDHIGGAAAVVADFRPREIWEGIPVATAPALTRLRDLAVTQGAGWRRLQAGDLVALGGVTVFVWHPSRPDWERQRVRNDDSLVLEIRHRDVSFVLPGDIGAEVERTLAAVIPAAPVRVLKVPHHGSGTSSTPAFVEALRPDVAVVSAGRYNRFGHPSPDVVQRYEDQGAVVLSTAERGAVSVCSDGRRVWGDDLTPSTPRPHRP